MVDTILKRFVIFGGNYFYPRGGFTDLLGCEDSLRDAVLLAEKLEEDNNVTGTKIEWWHIVDLLSGEIIRRSLIPPHGGSEGNEHSRAVKYIDGDLVSAHSEEEESEESIDLSQQLICTPADIHESLPPMLKLARLIFIKIGITYQGYLERYYEYFRVNSPDAGSKEFSRAAMSHRKFLLDDRSIISESMMIRIMDRIGYDVDEILKGTFSASIRIADRKSKEVLTFSSLDSID